MARPAPTPGEDDTHDAQEAATASASLRRGRGRTWLIAVCLCVAGASTALIDARASEAGSGLPRRTLADDEIQALWERRPVPSAAHRGYIFIDEADIVDGTELPLFRVEASRYGTARQLERMAVGDPGLAARIADLAPELARETEISRRADAAFYSRRSCAARRDTPESPDLVGPAIGLLLQAVRNR